MEKLVLTKSLMGTGEDTYIDFFFEKLSFSSEYKGNDISSDGIYFSDIKNSYVLVFTYEGVNYLYLINELIELGSNISVKYYCGVEKEESWVKITDDDNLIFSYSFINKNQRPYIDFISGVEDWDIFNWVYDLANYINKAKNNPNEPLFPSQNNEIS